jgi:hypothetical protein
MHRRSITDEDGTLIHLLEYEGGESTFDSVAIRYPIETDSRLHVLGYVGEDAAYQESFEVRDLSFAPVSAMGKGEMDSAVGLTLADEHDDGDETVKAESATGYTDFDGVPRSVMLALLGVGYTVVPDGRRWLDVE